MSKKNWRGKLDAKFEDLNGKTLVAIDGLEVGSDKVRFTTTDGDVYQMSHYQDCCENCRVEDICGDPESLIGQKILMAEETTSGDQQPGQDVEYVESFTWTFYRIATFSGTVVIRWLGESSGYYSESVDFELLTDGLKVEG